MQIRARILAYMKREGLKPYPWSDRAGLSPNTLKTFLDAENPNRAVNTTTLQALAAAQGISVQEMLADPTDDGGANALDQGNSAIIALLSDIRVMLKRQSKLIERNNALLKEALTASSSKSRTASASRSGG